MFEVVEDEKPEQIRLDSGANFHFSFIVDRSGSMSCDNRMPLAVSALSLFIRSLPSNCTFSVISFGSHFEALHFNK